MKKSIILAVSLLASIPVAKAGGGSKMINKVEDGRFSIERLIEIKKGKAQWTAETPNFADSELLRSLVIQVNALADMSEYGKYSHQYEQAFMNYADEERKIKGIKSDLRKNDPGQILVKFKWIRHLISESEVEKAHYIRHSGPSKTEDRDPIN